MTLPFVTKTLVVFDILYPVIVDCFFTKVSNLSRTLNSSCFFQIL